ncbi:hypothetical protein NC652_032844 [Populus alba x Populus x berolinensis]|nr:hypothetical protein NC652_032844 [Populus alba x Populus x berolinensis]
MFPGNLFSRELRCKRGNKWYRLRMYRVQYPVFAVHACSIVFSSFTSRCYIQQVPLAKRSFKMKDGGAMRFDYFPRPTKNWRGCFVGIDQSPKFMRLRSWDRSVAKALLKTNSTSIEVPKSYSTIDNPPVQCSDMRSWAGMGNWQSTRQKVQLHHILVTIESNIHRSQ